MESGNMLLCDSKPGTTESEPILASGHKGAFWRGPKASNGSSTIVKKSTGWEVLVYLGMALRLDEAMCALARMAPPVIAIFSLEGDQADVWIFVEKEENRPRLEALHRQLRQEGSQTNGYNEVMDTARWGICLIDVTDGMLQPCLADIKIGSIRHSPYAPAEKLTRIMKQRWIQPLCIRLCGALHYFCRDASNERCLEVERCEKEVGYALETEEEYLRCIRGFLSSTVSMIPRSNNNNNNDNNRMTCSDNELLLSARLKACHGQIQEILDFFKGPVGSALLERTAFVSTSLFFVYEASSYLNAEVGDSSAADVRVYLIDYARVSDRRLNFTEEKIGFVRGLENLLRLLS